MTPAERMLVVESSLGRARAVGAREETEELERALLDLRQWIDRLSDRHRRAVNRDIARRRGGAIRWEEIM